MADNRTRLSYITCYVNNCYYKTYQTCCREIGGVIINNYNKSRQHNNMCEHQLIANHNKNNKSCFQPNIISHITCQDIYEIKLK